jgi:hypothetical protein
LKLILAKIPTRLETAPPQSLGDREGQTHPVSPRHAAGRRRALMLESLLRADRPTPAAFDATLLGALERASGAIARLDQALDNHPLRPAFLCRARLEAVRRQASVDGHGIDPWHLAAVLEGLRLRMDHALRIVDRG